MTLKFLKKRGFSFAILVLSMCCYLSVLVPPALFWPASILGYGIPLMIIINVSLLALTLLVRKKVNPNYLIGFIFSVPFIWMSFGLSVKKAKATPEAVKILSYNAKLFRQTDTYRKFSTETINWVINHEADIKCIQEFSYNSDHSHLDVLTKFQEIGYYTHNFELDLIHNPGLAIMSKFPIIRKGVIDIDSSSVNNIIFADIVFNADTLRVYNVHFKSMHLELNSYKDLNIPRKDLKSLINKLRYGAINRSHQIDGLLKHLANCNYPIIICGDFNETPYSFNYIRLRSHFRNSFEKAGQGLGLSYASQPIRLRIDHHFYNNKLSVQDYELDYDISSSDHFPTIGTYTIP